jgi:Ion channel
MSNFQHGPLTEAARNFFYFAKWLSPMQWMGLIYPKFYRPRGELDSAEITDPKYVADRARAIDFYIIACVFVEIALAIFACFGPWPLYARVLLVILVAFRIVEIVQVTVNAVLFDAVSGRSDQLVASTTRMVVLAGINFFELLLCFAIIYATDYMTLSKPDSPVLAFYVSIVTQLSLGYSDVFPTGWLRIVAATQVLVGFLFVVLVLGRFIASLRSIRSILNDGSQ